MLLTLFLIRLVQLHFFGKNMKGRPGDTFSFNLNCNIPKMVKDGKTSDDGMGSSRLHFQANRSLVQHLYLMLRRKLLLRFLVVTGADPYRFPPFYGNRSEVS